MPAARKSTLKTAATAAPQGSESESVVTESPVVSKKRTSRKKVVENKAVVNKTPSVDGVFTVDIPKTTDMMERVKSKVEMFSKGEYTGLLKNIIEIYGARLGVGDPVLSRRKAYEEFKTQITENQNGVFLNLTSCSEDLWQACVQCIEQLERQHTDFEKLDKERRRAIEEIAKNV